MSDLTLVHLSDLHFAADNYELPPEEALTKAAAVISRDFSGPLTVAITGDITTMGRDHGYVEATRVIRRTLLRTCEVSKIVVCPGNHDISSDSQPFAAFNRFAFALTNDSAQSWGTAQPVRVVLQRQYALVLVNSAHHGDYRYGQVPTDELRKALSRIEGKYAIVLLHHSPISSIYGGAALMNAYEFLATASGARVCGVLHGHIHSEQVLSVGRRPSFLAGVGSLGFRPDPNMNNQFAVHQLDNGRLVRSASYRYTLDRRDFMDAEIPQL